MTDDKFLEEVLVFVDRRGTIVEKFSGRMSTTLRMKYEQGDLSITMHAFAHGMGNGSCAATVTYQGKVVYDAAGHFTSSPYNTKVKTYHPGPWEQVMGLTK